MKFLKKVEAAQEKTITIDFEEITKKLLENIKGNSWEQEEIHSLASGKGDCGILLQVLDTQYKFGAKLAKFFQKYCTSDYRRKHGITASPMMGLNKEFKSYIKEAKRVLDALDSRSKSKTFSQIGRGLDDLVTQVIEAIEKDSRI